LNPFEQLPEEILSHILSFLPTFSDFGRVSNCCQRFLEIPRREHTIWKNSCFNWWKRAGFEQRHFDLEWTFKESGKNDWQWLARCFCKDQSRGLSWLLYRDDDQTEHIRLGELDGEEIKGWGMNIFPSVIAVRYFTREALSHGKVVWKNGDKYEGTWNSKDNFEGLGVLFWNDGSKYEGEWKSGKRHGRGVFAWPEGRLECTYQEELKQGIALVVCKDGYRFEAEFEQDLPKEEEGSIHPSVLNCIQTSHCTVAGGSRYLPQYLFSCQECDKFYCSVCWNYCHSGDGHSWKKRWRVGNCDCGNEGKCTRSPIPPSKRQKQQH